MAYKKVIREIFAKGHETFLRNVSVDCIIFGFHSGELKVLLLKGKYSDNWSLPGGFIRIEENIDESAHRILQERTGLTELFLQQFKVFGQADRETLSADKKFLRELGIKQTRSWLFERFITVGYYALVDFNKVKTTVDDLSSSCEWYSISELPEMILDHAEIMADALEYLRFQLNYHPIGYELLPEKFTMPDLQKLYETILGRSLDRRNFQRKILGVGILKRLQEKPNGKAQKLPFLYKFDMRKYQKALQSGLGFQL